MANLVQIYDIELLASDTVEHAALIVEEDDLEGLELLCELAGRDVGVDIEDLASVGLGQAGEDGERAGANGGFDGTLVDLCDFSDEAVLVLVEVVGGEYSGGDRTGAGAKFFKSTDKLQVFFQENASCNLQSLGI